MLVTSIFSFSHHVFYPIREKHFLPFSHHVSTLSKRNRAIGATLKLSSANTFNLDRTKLLSYGKMPLNPFPNDKF